MPIRMGKLLQMLLGILSLCLFLTMPVHSADSPPPIALDLPIDCQVGQDCWIINYPDHGLGIEASDYRCGGLTYTGSKGTDFALRDLAVMADGVEVKAAAPGKVKAVRDGVIDRFYKEEQKDEIKGKECGNGVIIDHGNGWESQYCHMRRGSILVDTDDIVVTGQPLGLVGLSGMTQFPHLDMTLRYLDDIMDPFTGEKITASCQRDDKSLAKSLWRQSEQGELVYQRTSFYKAGFVTARPERDDLWRGDSFPDKLPTSIPALVFWVELIGVEKGDQLQIQITGPDDSILINQEIKIEKNEIVYLQYMGKQRPKDGWKPGPYKAVATYTKSTMALVPQAKIDIARTIELVKY